MYHLLLLQTPIINCFVDIYVQEYLVNINFNFILFLITDTHVLIWYAYVHIYPYYNILDNYSFSYDIFLYWGVFNIGLVIRISKMTESNFIALSQNDLHT